MTSIERSITIESDAESIWKYAVDSDHISEWFEGLADQIPDENWPGLNATATNVYSAAGLRLELQITIIEYEEYEKITFQMQGMLTGTFTWEYSEGDGATTIDVYLDYELAGGALGQLANKMVFERQNVTNIEKTLANLKARMES